MLCNYHTHTERCRHAIGEDREYVESAITAGLKILGFSDHAPYIFDGNYYSYYRMFIEQTEEYVNSVLSLKKEYQKDIDIRLGFELEYYPDKHQREMEFLKNFNPDYIIMGQHFVGCEPNGVYVAGGCDDNFLKSYVEQCIEGLKTGDFTYLAHPDIAGYDYSPSAIDSYYGKLLRYCKSENIPIEINVLGITSNRWYSKRKIFELAENIANEVIIGIDAHSPSAITKSAFDTANSLINGLNLNLIEKLNI